MTIEYQCAPGTVLGRPTGPIPKCGFTSHWSRGPKTDSAMLRGIGHAQDNGAALRVGRGGL